MPVFAATITVDFETFLDGDSITTELPGLTFSNTIVYSAGISLNEFEFPPRSGFNVASDLGAPITILFDTPISSVWAYFTYLVPIKMEAFDAGSKLVGTATSLFSSNLALSGDPGSAPNERLRIDSSGISAITITGDLGGGSFVMDDLTYGRTDTVVPEPATWLSALALACFTFLRRR